MIYLKEFLVKGSNDCNAYPFNIDLFKTGFSIQFTKNVTIIVGENGSGKSTILRYIADNAGFNLDGGNINSTYKSYTSDLEIKNINLRWRIKTQKGFYFRSDTFDTYYKYLETDSELAKIYKNRFSKLSHGQSFLRLFDYFHDGILLLDEPESALSPQNQLVLLKIIHDLDISDKAQIIILTHSPIIMTYPNAELMIIDKDKITTQNYKETDHYFITKTMLDNPEKIYRVLFAKE